MIYFVDEDVRQMDAWAATLETFGHTTIIIRDADAAFGTLCSANDIQLVLIDVMLAADPRAERRRYSRDATDNFQSTGLRLLEDLIQCRPDHFPLRAVLLSNAGKRQIVDKIETTAKSHGVPYWKKRFFNDISEFAARTNERLRQISNVK